MNATRNSCPPLMQKDDALMIQEKANGRKYETVVTLRDEYNLTWQEIGNRMHYAPSYARRLYLKAKAVMQKESKNLRVHPTAKKCPDSVKFCGEEASPFIKQEETNFIRACVNVEKYRTVLILRDKYHLKFREIAKLTGFSKSCVVDYYNKAIQLKQMSEQSIKTAQPE